MCARHQTHVRALFSLSLSENPLICSCSSYTQKIWMRQHRKWLDTERRGPKVGPQCAEPRSLEERHLLAVKVRFYSFLPVAKPSGQWIIIPLFLLLLSLLTKWSKLEHQKTWEHSILVKLRSGLASADPQVALPAVKSGTDTRTE